MLCWFAQNQREPNMITKVPHVPSWKDLAVISHINETLQNPLGLSFTEFSLGFEKEIKRTGFNRKKIKILTNTYWNKQRKQLQDQHTIFYLTRWHVQQNLFKKCWQLMTSVHERLINPLGHIIRKHGEKKLAVVRQRLRKGFESHSTSFSFNQRLFHP